MATQCFVCCIPIPILMTMALMVMPRMREQVGVSCREALGKGQALCARISGGNDSPERFAFGK